MNLGKTTIKAIDAVDKLANQLIPLSQWTCSHMQETEEPTMSRYVWNIRLHTKVHHFVHLMPDSKEL